MEIRDSSVFKAYLSCRESTLGLLSLHAGQTQSVEAKRAIVSSVSKQNECLRLIDLIQGDLNETQLKAALQISKERIQMEQAILNAWIVGEPASERGALLLKRTDETTALVTALRPGKSEASIGYLGWSLIIVFGLMVVVGAIRRQGLHTPEEKALMKRGVMWMAFSSGFGIIGSAARGAAEKVFKKEQDDV